MHITKGPNVKELKLSDENYTTKLLDRFREIGLINENIALICELVDFLLILYYITIIKVYI